MAIIIGTGTIVSFAGACVASAQWSAAQNTQRLYCLGQTDAEFVYNKPTETLNLTIYAGTGPSNYNTVASTTCGIPNTIAASLTAAACGGGSSVSFSGDWFVNSYSYSKDDPLLPGQESWGLMRWIAGPGGDPPEPGAIIRGVSEGQTTDVGVLDTGITLDSEGQTTSSQGSVQAGGIGKTFEIIMGVVNAVGGGASIAGETGQGSANVPYTPLWI
jgi:hypothetical protein